jgi:hypothetical protein
VLTKIANKRAEKKLKKEHIGPGLTALTKHLRHVEKLLAACLHQ